MTYNNIVMILIENKQVVPIQNIKQLGFSDLRGFCSHDNIFTGGYGHSENPTISYCQPIELTIKIQTFIDERPKLRP